MKKRAGSGCERSWKAFVLISTSILQRSNMAMSIWMASTKRYMTMVKGLSHRATGRTISKSILMMNLSQCCRSDDQVKENPYNHWAVSDRPFYWPEDKRCGRFLAGVIKLQERYHRPNRHYGELYKEDNQTLGNPTKKTNSWKRRRLAQGGEYASMRAI